MLNDYVLTPGEQSVADKAFVKARKIYEEDTFLTTKDNPFDPFTDFDGWNAWDIRQGYHTLSYLARVVVTSSELSPVDQAVAIDDAMNEIIEEQVFGDIYVKVVKPKH